MKASNAASASLLVSAIQISCNDRLAFGCWLFGSLLRTLAVLCTQQRCSRVVGHSSATAGAAWSLVAATKGGGNEPRRKGRPICRAPRQRRAAAAVQCVGRRHREIDPGRGRKGDCDQQLGGRGSAGLQGRKAIPITLVEQIIARIVSTIDAPVSVDFEG